MSTKRNASQYVQTKVIALAIILIVFILLCILFFKGVAINSYNRRELDNGRLGIDKIYQSAIEKIGNTDNHKTDSYCRSHKREFTNPTFSCYVQVSFIYGVSNENKANSIMKDVQQIIKEQDFIPSRMQSSEIEDSVSNGKMEHFAVDQYKYNGLVCYSTYSYNSPSRIDLSINNEQLQPFEISLSCGGAARTPYYPLRT